MKSGFREFLALTEAGKNAVKVTFKKSKYRWTSTFDINNIEYNIEAYTNNELDTNFEIWEFKFYKDKNTTQITGDFKSHFVLVPTIIDAFDEFVKEKKPDCVLFLASDESKSTNHYIRVIQMLLLANIIILALTHIWQIMIYYLEYVRKLK